MLEPSHRYSPPQAEVKDIVSATEGELAGRWQRFFNFVIDYLCFVGLAFIIGFVVAVAGGDAGLQLMRSIPDLVFGVALMAVYYIVLEGVFGRTLGKIVTGTRVVGVDGRRPSLPKIIGRSLLRFIPFEALTFFGPNGRGWHDRLSGTRVIKVR
jgi:uncharacterized RDD family membrane protein YckC